MRIELPFPDAKRDCGDCTVRILAIDPGTTESGWVIYENGSVDGSGVFKNEDFAGFFHYYEATHLVIEMIASYGMAVGKEVFETCVWIGRFIEVWSSGESDPPPAMRMYRREAKLHLCGTARAKDTNIRQALIDKLGPQGTKKAPGPTYGVKSHAWAALAVAVTYAELGDKSTVGGVA